MLTKVPLERLGDALAQDRPEELRGRLRSAKTISARVNSVGRLDLTGVDDPTVLLRLRLIEHRVTMLRDAIEQDRLATSELAALVVEAGSTLTSLVGIAPRAAAVILAEVGDIRHSTESRPARFNGMAPSPASSGEGGSAPVRRRPRVGNRLLSAAISALR